MDQLSYQLGQIDGQLIAFAKLNGKVNHEYDFALTPLPAGTNAEQAMRQCLLPSYDDATFAYQPQPDWQAALNKQLNDWLFSFQPQFDDAEQALRGGCGSSFACLKDVDASFILSRAEARTELVQQLMQQIDAAIKVKRLTSVVMDSAHWYEACWNDFVIEGEHATLFLHLGVSD
ncbi:hypothetical protein L9G74_01670 [Shewanella sp. C32]|uniref:Uncharacterized protein n=1 Tax=Shewanella electrica TaxID=515560 RepID=A0ABT2FGS4_9GAMM|nr:hypothetical protein [Shewanella electrica]MCH1925312.1 hypothetical protein [Shewanella electrica]MCS4555137.1 hypothetical protein [Shewanella electrica]